MARIARSVVVPVRVPKDVYAAVMVRIHAEDLSFSRYVRRAIRKDLEQSGCLQSRESFDLAALLEK